MREVSGAEVDKAIRLIQAVYYNSPGVQPTRSLEIGTQFAARTMYTMWRYGEKADRRRRQATGCVASSITIAFDAIDDVVDGTPDVAERLITYDEATAHALDGTCKCKDTCPDVFRMAIALHDAFLAPSKRLRETCADIIGAGREQITSTSIPEQYKAMQVMGAQCMRLILNAGEYVEQRAAPLHIDSAIAALGICAYMLDTGYEISEDLKDKTPNYATLRIANGEEIEAVKHGILSEAKYYRRRGAELLVGPREVWRYNMLATLMSMRYRLSGKGDQSA